MSKRGLIGVLVGAILLTMIGIAGYGYSPGDPLKAAFIYVGPVGDYGWSHAHDVGRKYVDAKFPWLETVCAEAVPEADAYRYIERFIVEEECDVIFTTSFGFMDPTLEAANNYPYQIFFHCSGYKRAPNMGTYFSEFHQVYYANGLIAGAMTKSGKVGYIGAYPIPEVVRHINAFALGVKEANPAATVDVRWLFAWYDPPKARLAAEALIADGCDALAFTEDSPTVVQVGKKYVKEGKPVYTFGHYSPMQEFGEDSCVSGQLVHWEVLYEDILAKVYAGVYDRINLQEVDYWWMLKEGACELGGDFGVPINPKFEAALKEKKVTDPVLGEISVYDLVMIRLAQMSEETVLFDPFTGQIRDQEGKVRIEEGRRGSHDELWLMDWFVDNIVGEIPR
ncbi:BMP family ABC transporter substrate-binding protein [Patescibacteria group bacterium]|nr:BMP family ABC transporter substrate-binding protein [Patescibacteria group bacterium]